MYADYFANSKTEEVFLREASCKDCVCSNRYSKLGTRIVRGAYRLFLLKARRKLLLHHLTLEKEEKKVQC